METAVKYAAVLRIHMTRKDPCTVTDTALMKGIFDPSKYIGTTAHITVTAMPVSSKESLCHSIYNYTLRKWRQSECMLSNAGNESSGSSPNVNKGTFF